MTGLLSRFSTLCLFLLLATGASAQLRPDSLFHQTGYNNFKYYIYGTPTLGLKVALTPSGESIVAGRVNYDLAVYKFRADGAVDSSFGQGGCRIMALPFPFTSDVVDVQLQRDRKILVLASAHWQTYSNGMAGYILLARFLPNGTPDSSFHQTGYLMHRAGSGFECQPKCMTLDTLGATDKIYVGSLATESGYWNCPIGFGRWCVSKYTDSGNPDSSFNGTSYLLQSSSAIRPATTTPMALVLALKVVAGGQLMVAGALNIMDSAYFSLRLNPNGSYSTSYGQNGRSVSPVSAFGIPTAVVTSAHFLPDNSILFVTQDPYYYPSYDSSGLYVVRQDAQGALMNSYGTNGILSYSYLGNIHKVSVDRNGGFVLCWYYSMTTTQQIHFARFTANGIPDNTFGTNGHISTEPILHDTYFNRSTVNDVLWSPDNSHLTVLGFRSSQQYQGYYGIFRYVMDQKTTGIISPAEHTGLNVYPNPTSGILNIGLTSGLPVTALRLTDLQGRVVLQLPAAARIDISALPAGTYFLQAATADKYNAGRLIVKY